MTVIEPKMTIFKPLFPITAQMATSVIQNKIDFKRTVVKKLSLYKIMIEIVIFNLFLSFST